MRLTEDQFASLQKRLGVVSQHERGCAAAPTAEALGFVLDLPTPLSVNRIWRKTKAGVSKSKDYDRWIKRADDMLLELGQLKGVRPIAGRFTALIICKRSNLDLDNNAKSVLDFLQSRNFIANDRFCEELTLRWGDAPTGCRVTVLALPTVNDVLRTAAERLEGAL